MTLGVCLALLLGACQAPQTERPVLQSRVDQLSKSMNQMRDEMVSTRQTVKAMEVTERSARDDLFTRIDEIESAVTRLPRSMRSICATQATVTETCDDSPETRLVEVKEDKTILGSLERPHLVPPDVTVVARMDTGASSSSLHAENLVTFERDGEEWVRFEVISEGENHEVEAAVIRHVRVLQQADPKGTRRPVVGLRVLLGNLDEIVEFTLADRSHLDNAVILGRNFLTDVAMVDVGRRFVQPARPQTAAE